MNSNQAVLIREENKQESSSATSSSGDEDQFQMPMSSGRGNARRGTVKELKGADAQRPAVKGDRMGAMRRTSSASTLMKFRFALRGATRELIDKKRTQMARDQEAFLASPFR